MGNRAGSGCTSTLITGADQLQPFLTAAEIERAAHTYQGQRHGDTDAVEIIEQVILLGQIERP